MSSSNSTSTSNSTSPGDTPRSSTGLGAATYYGAVAAVVFVLVALTVVSRVLYTRKARRLARQRSIDSTSRDTEERVAMERRGEASGLPTYRESVQPTSRNPILDSTPLSDSPVNPQRTSVDTLPALTVTTTLALSPDSAPQISPPAYRIPPPKYEDAAEEERDTTTHIVGQAIDSEDHTTILHEMRMRNDSVVTLVVPSINVLDVDCSVPPAAAAPTDQPPPAEPLSQPPIEPSSHTLPTHSVPHVE